MIRQQTVPEPCRNTASILLLGRNKDGRIFHTHTYSAVAVHRPASARTAISTLLPKAVMRMAYYAWPRDTWLFLRSFDQSSFDRRPLIVSLTALEQIGRRSASQLNAI